MPSYSANNPRIGDAGELWFASQLPTGWVWQPPRRDVGKDALIVVKDGSDLDNLEFSVQVKTTRRPRVERESVSYSGVPTSAVLYWFSSPQPTLFVVVDSDRRTAWYSWHLDLFASPSDIFGKTTCTVKLPLSNVLDAAGWLRIRERLAKHYGALRDALRTAHMASRVVPSIRAIASAARDLVWLDHERDRPKREDFAADDHDAVFLLIHDQCCYRDIMGAVRASLELFQSGSYTHSQVALWLRAFEANVLSAYPDFAAFPTTNDFAGVQITFNAPVLKSTRGILIGAALDLIVMLSDGSPPGPSDRTSARA
jgi:Domain of unknown function (DUF4365)